MEEDDKTYLSHQEITFAVGDSSLVVTPGRYLIRPSRSKFEPIYCDVNYWDEGVHRWFVVTVFEPEHFHTLATAFKKLMKGEPAAAKVSGISGELAIECAWNQFEKVIVFKAKMQHWESCEKGMMKASVELEFWMEPGELDEPLAGIEAILEHVRVLRESDQ